MDATEVTNELTREHRRALNDLAVRLGDGRWSVDRHELGVAISVAGDLGHVEHVIPNAGLDSAVDVDLPLTEAVDALVLAVGIIEDAPEQAAREEAEDRFAAIVADRLADFVADNLDGQREVIVSGGEDGDDLVVDDIESELDITTHPPTRYIRFTLTDGSAFVAVFHEGATPPAAGQ